MKKINLASKYNKINEHWSPKVVAEMNDYQFKLAKIKNDFIWHSHEDTDETFIVSVVFSFSAHERYKFYINYKTF